MTCKYCTAPIERTIEGEPVCPTCWTGRQMDSGELEYDRRIKDFHNWARNHCESCGERHPGGGICPECEAERARIEDGLWFDDLYDEFDEVDWGTGELSPDEELRRAALDHKGRP